MRQQVSRRDFIKAVGGGLVLASIGEAVRAAGGGVYPNIVFILADDMGYGDLGCQNPESKIPTPNLDRLAGEGMRFTDAHSPSAVCSPTRYAILTGRYAWRSRLKRGVLGPWGRTLIEPGRLTVAAMLKMHGYVTGCVGKWHLGWDWRSRDGRAFGEGDNKDWRDIDFSKPVGGGPTTVGFDYYHGTSVPNYPPYCFMENDRTVGIPTVMKPDTMFGNPGPMLEGWTLEPILPAIAEKATAFIRGNGRTSEGKPFGRVPGRPFFLYVPLTAPHTPIAPIPEFVGRSGAGRYGDFVCQVDHTVGQILKALEANGLAKDTLVIFTSDNGSPQRDGTNMSGAVGSVKQYGHDPSRPLRGIKADIWDGGHRVPFLARWPGRIGGGTVNAEPICHVDFMATVSAIVQHPLPADAAEDSYNILDVLEGRKRSEPIRPAVVHHSSEGMFAIRQGKWKLILGKGSGGWSRPKAGELPDAPPGQLYDMSKDIAEGENLYSEHPEIVARLTQLLNRYQEDGRSTPVPRSR